MLDHSQHGLSEGATSLKNLGLDQRKISPEMEAAIDRGRAALKAAAPKGASPKAKGGSGKFRLSRKALAK